MEVEKKFKRVECLGIVDKFSTPKGMQTFYDTGRKLSAVDLAKEIYDFATRIAKKANVYPIGYAALAEDGRIFVTEPWFESKV